MSDEPALLAAIWEHPHDDTVRLAYADWLDENGQPERAEFIRTQIALAQLDEWDDSPDKVRLQEREQRLWKKHGKEWKSHLPNNLPKTAGFHRGFPRPQPRTLTAARFLALSDDDLAGAPLWNFRLPTNLRRLPDLVWSPNLLRVGALDIRYWLETDADVMAFAGSRFVRNIAELNIQTSRFGDAGAECLAERASGLPSLRDLNLESSRLSRRGLAALVASPLADGLRSLQLWGNCLGTEGVLALASAPRLARLERLDITNCEDGLNEEELPIAQEAVAALFASPHLASLKCLFLGARNFRPSGMRQLCATRPVFRLRVLRLAHFWPRLVDAHIEILADWPGLADLRVLHLYGNEIGERGALALARSPYLTRLTELRVDLNPLSDIPAAVEALVARFGPDVVKHT